MQIITIEEKKILNYYSYFYCIYINICQCKLRPEWFSQYDIGPIALELTIKF